jgi:hypothetical protein
MDGKEYPPVYYFSDMNFSLSMILPRFQEPVFSFETKEPTSTFIDYYEYRFVEYEPKHQWTSVESYMDYLKRFLAEEQHRSFVELLGIMWAFGRPIPRDAERDMQRLLELEKSQYPQSAMTIVKFGPAWVYRLKQSNCL